MIDISISAIGGYNKKYLDTQSLEGVNLATFASANLGEYCPLVIDEFSNLSSLWGTATMVVFVAGLGYFTGFFQELAIWKLKDNVKLNLLNLLT